ncbi:hypothetical protein [Hyphomicrobium nitrativorans]|uniref:hypothetical protein n=1 Tax=Hyphomicrobium nitrativorans TaxID=1427356 RepID=UPI0011823050|nr:hypothetical protein [Hyphomicrobium nitrativorans]
MSLEQEPFLKQVRSRLALRRITLAILGVLATAILGALISGAGKPLLSWAEMRADGLRDDWLCGGRAAMAEGDRLTALAEREEVRASEFLSEANASYQKAYDCGFPDAGLRLAVANCLGLGTPKNNHRARQLVLEVEGKYREKAGRASDVRKLCDL